MKHFLFTFVLLALFAEQVNSQLVIDNTQTVEYYVQEVLLGAGVAVSNITFNGQPASTVNMQIGEFDSQNANVGIPSGIVLASGDVNFVVGPNNSSAMTLGNLNTFGGTDPDLQALIPGFTINNWAILEFDFVPNGDTLSFNFVFGSEEYLEWVGTSFNDVFGFFLSGPGISGPYSNNAENIASIPGTDVAVSINNLNSTSYSEFYVNNGDGFSAPQSTDDTYIQLDGFTLPLQALALVQCGESYHIKICIADAGDGILDSAVFLEEGSFTSNSVVDVDLSINVGGPDADIIWEDCGEATITFTRSPLSDISVEDLVIVTWTGSAEMGVDYNMQPDTIFFAAGVASVSFEVDAFEDGITEGMENVFLDILNLAACNGSGLVSNFEFFIGDHPEDLVVEGFDSEICLGASIDLEPIITGGYGNYSFQWSNGDETETIQVSPLNTETYNIIVSDTCGMPSDDADFLVEILFYDPLEIEITDPAEDPILLDCGEWIAINAIAQGGDGIYTYYWYNQEDQNLFGWMNSVTISSWSNADYVYVDVTDGCGFISTDSVEIQLNVPALIVDVPSTISAPCNQPFDIEAIVSGGAAPYNYSWLDNGMWLWDWDNILNYNVGSPTTIQLTVSDQCGQSESFNIEVSIDSPPIQIDLVDELVGTCFTVFDLNPEVTDGSGGFTFEWTENGSLVSNNEDISFQTDVNTVLIFQVEDACGATASDNVIINLENPPVIIEVGEDIFASCIDLNLLDVDISSGSGGYQYQWIVNNTEMSINAAYEIQTFETVDVNVIVEDACGSMDSDTLTIFIPNIPLQIAASVDTSICPNGTVLMWAIAQGGEEGFVYDWPQLGFTGDEVTLNGPGSSASYTVTATDICGESISAYILVEVLPISAQFLVSEIGENTYQFTATPEPACEEGECFYMWEFGDGTISFEENPVHEYDGLGSYTTYFTVVNDIGCSDMQPYTIQGPPDIFIPNSFTPNGDGINDIFSVVSHDLLEFDIKIFNRWGEMVYQSNDPAAGWAGGHKGGEYFSPDGVYTYVARIKGYNTDAQEFAGSITLIR